MRGPNPISVSLILLAVIPVVFAGLPSEKNVLVDQTLVTEEDYPYTVGQIETFANVGETVHISVKTSDSVVSNVSIVSEFLYQQYSGRGLDISLTENNINRSSSIRIIIRSVTITSSEVYIYVEGNDVQRMSYLFSLVLILAAIAIEFMIRRLHPPYLEDESRSISAFGMLIPIVILANEVLTDNAGIGLDYRYNPQGHSTVLYYRSLHIEEVLSKFMNISTLLVLYVLLSVSVIRAFSKKRLRIYKTLPVNPLRQYLIRVSIWTGLVLSISSLTMFFGLFSRNGEFEGYGMFYSVYVYSIAIAVIVFLNMVLLHVNVLDTLQGTSFAALIVPLLMLLSVLETIPPIPMFETFHRVNSEMEYQPVEVPTLVLRQLFYTIVLLIYGVGNRKRPGFRSGS